MSSTELAGGLDHYQFDTYRIADSEGSVQNDHVYRDVTNPLGLKKHYYTLFNYSDGNLTPFIYSIDTFATAHVPANTVTYGDYYAVEGSRTDGRGVQRIIGIDDNNRYVPVAVAEAVGLTEERQTNFTWHAKFDLPLTVAKAGLTTTYTYSTTGQLLTETQKDTTTQTVPYSTKNQTRTWTYVWNTNGTLASVNGPKAAVGTLDDKTLYGYDTNGNLQTVTDALGHVTTFATFDANGRPASMTDPNGIITNFTYDGLGRTTAMTVKHPTNVALDASTSFDYDVESRVTGITLPDTDKLIVDYNLAGRVTAVRAASGERIDYVRNAMGGVTSETIRRADTTTRSTITRTFDELNRVLSVTLGAGRTKTYQYDANDNIVQTQLARSNATTAAFDGLNRLTSAVASDTGTTGLAYDPKDGLTSFTDPISVTTTFIRNGFGEVIREVSPDRGTTTYYRDATGDVTAVIDGRNQRVDIVRDFLGRITSKTPVSRPASEVITYTYDGCGLGSYLINRLGCVTYSYDGENRLTRTTGNFGTTHRYDYNFDTNGNRTSVDARDDPNQVSPTSSTPYTLTSGKNRLASTEPGRRCVQSHMMVAVTRFRKRAPAALRSALPMTAMVA